MTNKRKTNDKLFDDITRADGRIRKYTNNPNIPTDTKLGHLTELKTAMSANKVMMSAEITRKQLNAKK